VETFGLVVGLSSKLHAICPSVHLSDASTAEPLSATQRKVRTLFDDPIQVDFFIGFFVFVVVVACLLYNALQEILGSRNYKFFFFFFWVVVVFPSQGAHTIARWKDKVGKAMEFRVVSVDTEKRKIVLTAKKTLVQSNLRIITDFNVEVSSAFHFSFFLLHWAHVHYL
jgi:hypothetical protein